MKSLPCERCGAKDQRIVEPVNEGRYKLYTKNDCKECKYWRITMTDNDKIEPTWVLKIYDKI